MSRIAIPSAGGPGAPAVGRSDSPVGPDQSSLPGGIDGVLVDRIADWLVLSSRSVPAGRTRRPPRPVP